MATFQQKIISLLALKVRTDFNSHFERHAAHVAFTLNFSHKIVWAEKQTECFANCLAQTDTISVSLTNKRVTELYTSKLQKVFFHHILCFIYIFTQFVKKLKIKCTCLVDQRREYCISLKYFTPFVNCCTLYFYQILYKSKVTRRCLIAFS